MTAVTGSPTARNQARSAFDELYRTSYPRMMAVALAATWDRELAADAVQDAFAALWVRWESVSLPAAWLRRAVVSNCMDASRTARRREAILRRQPPPSAIQMEEPDDFHRLLAGLTERQRTAVTLKFVEDLTEADIASAMGCRVGTVKSTLNRAMAILRDRTEGDQL